MRLGDQRARDRIIGDTGSTLFVDAGAGSGKTRALVERVTTLVLTDGVPIAAIAAVTFTEKAAAELRDRLRARFELAAEDPDPVRAARAGEALDGLDSAAIGTLHSFARRILSEHPIEAGLPPVFEVRDEIASSIAFAQRWDDIVGRLLRNDELAVTLALARANGATFEHLRAIVKALGNDWDLIEPRVLSGDAPVLNGLDPGPVADRVREVVGLLDACSVPDTDKLALRITAIEPFADALDAAAGDAEQVVRLLLGLSNMGRVGNVGAKGNWAVPVNDVRATVSGLAAEAKESLAELRDDTLRVLVRFLAGQVRDAALERRAHGELEFHDLLVAARELLRDHPEVRAALHAKYQRLLLDEFQDTDPIQLEIATRIAGGAAADAPDWTGNDFDPGRLFVVGDPKQSIYRFRRADIAMYLRAGEALGERVGLSTNFRTTGPIVDWVNRVFRKLIEYDEDKQPEYASLDAFRTEDLAGAAVTVLGARAHDRQTRAPELREIEAADVAGVIANAVDSAWEVKDPDSGELRPIRYGDIAVLIPSRTSLYTLERALGRAQIPYHAEARSLVYASEEVRDLLICARAVADPADTLALVTALRSPLFGCGDDDLWHWKKDVGYFSVFGDADDVPEAARGNPVGPALRSLGQLTRRAGWMTPAEVLAEIVAERRMLEVAATEVQTVEKWRRLRFVLDQARGWSDAASDGLREYLTWVNMQATDNSRVTESVAGELGLDSVRILTVHAAKGLEFPMVVVSGMSGRPAGTRGAQLLWPKTGGFQVRLKGDLATTDFSAECVLDEQMDASERIRLLYVATTRARDHLVVSLHRAERKADSEAQMTMAQLLADSGAVQGAAEFVSVASPARGDLDLGRLTGWPEPITRELWEAQHAAVTANAARPASISASGLEGTAPEVMLAEVPPEEQDVVAGRAKGARDVELPPWSKGRYGSAIGRAVHAVLQMIDLAAPVGLDHLVRTQSVAEGVPGQADLVADLARSALASEVVGRAAERDHWRETLVATTRADGQVVEGYVDLIYREDDGRLVIVDYKTDAVPAGAFASRDRYYRPQLEAYAEALGAATGTGPAASLLYLHPENAVLREIVP